MGKYRPLSEECRERIEAAIARDENDKRIEQAKGRRDHYLEQKSRTVDGSERVVDPRGALEGSRVEPAAPEPEARTGQPLGDVEMADDDGLLPMPSGDGVDVDSVEEKRIDDEILH